VTTIIRRENGAELDLYEVLAVYEASGLAERRPVHDIERMAAMVRHANLVVTCRIDGRLVGIARCITDFAYVTYLSDMAVSREHQRTGIGRDLLEAVSKEAPQAKIVLLAAPAARGYYPRVGFEQHDSAWVRAR